MKTIKKLSIIQDKIISILEDFLLVNIDSNLNTFRESILTHINRVKRITSIEIAEFIYQNIHEFRYAVDAYMDSAAVTSVDQFLTLSFKDISDYNLQYEENVSNFLKISAEYSKINHQITESKKKLEGLKRLGLNDNDINRHKKDFTHIMRNMNRAKESLELYSKFFDSIDIYNDKISSLEFKTKIENILPHTEDVAEVSALEQEVSVRLDETLNSLLSYGEQYDDEFADFIKNSEIINPEANGDSTEKEAPKSPDLVLVELATLHQKMDTIINKMEEDKVSSDKFLEDIRRVSEETIKESFIKHLPSPEKMDEEVATTQSINDLYSLDNVMDFVKSSTPPPFHLAYTLIRFNIEAFFRYEKQINISANQKSNIDIFKQTLRDDNKGGRLNNIWKKSNTFVHPNAEELVEAIRENEFTIQKLENELNFLIDEGIFTTFNKLELKGNQILDLIGTRVEGKVLRTYESKGKINANIEVSEIGALLFTPGYQVDFIFETGQNVTLTLSKDDKGKLCARNVSLRDA